MAVGWNRLNLQLVGIWPEPTATSDASSTITALIVSAWLALFVTLPQATNLFMLNGNMNEITQTLCMAFMPSFIAILKVFVSLYYREGLKLLVKYFYDDWRRSKTEEERAVMLAAAKVWRFISILSTVVNHIVIPAFLGIRSFTIYTYGRHQESQAHLLLYIGYFPFNLRSTSIMLLTNVGQLVAAYCLTIPYTGVDAFIAMLVLHTCSQFENLRMRLERLMDEKDGTRSMDQVHKELIWIVKRHEHLNWWTTVFHLWVACKIEQYFNKLLLIQVVVCTVEICLQGFLFLNFAIYDADGIFNLQFLFFVIFVVHIAGHLYIYCYVGEKLLVQSNGMSNSAYNSSWFNVSPQEAKWLLFIMNRSIRPLQLTAGNFSTFSIDMFSTILRTAMGYLSFLLTVQADLRLAIGWNRLNLKLWGIWPEPKSTELGSPRYAALMPCLCVATFIVVPQSTNLFMLSGDLNEITNNLCLNNIPAFNSIVKILIT